MTKLMQFVALTAVFGCCLPTMITAGLWGDWGPAQSCPQGERAIGFQLKVESPQPGDGDDTALNAIALLCTRGSSIPSSQGIWGTWRQQFFCPSGRYITSCQLRVEPNQGSGDDTAANNLNCRCNDGTTLWGDGTDWGDWKGWYNGGCSNGIKGIQSQVEKDQGSGDDTALNDFRFLCF